MINVILIGCLGRLGCEITNYISDLDNYEIIAGVDVNLNNKKLLDYNVYENTESLIYNNIVGDVVIDFSNSSAIKSTLDYCKKTASPLVIGTTGLSEIDEQEIRIASEIIPIFCAVNMSVGINILTKICKNIIELSDDIFDIDIIEKHHNKKLDAPSGTAIMIADLIKSKYEQEHDIKKTISNNNYNLEQPRDKDEIRVYSIRAGNIIGDHHVTFSCDDEILTVSHVANSKKVFAKGAINAAKFIINQKPGLYGL